MLDYIKFLHLPLCAKWFDLIEQQEKSEEYRKESDWLLSRLENFVKEPEKRHYIIFSRGYTREHILIECTQIFKRARAKTGFSIWETLALFSNNYPQSNPLLIPEWGYERCVNNPKFDYVFSLQMGKRVEVL